MFFALDPANGVAIYEQIVRQVKFAVASGALHAGDAVPSVRELARELVVNPNTVARAYRELQDDGVLHPVRGSCLEVAPAAARHCRSEREKLLRLRLHQVLEECFQSGLPQADVRHMLDTELAAIWKTKG